MSGSVIRSSSTLIKTGKRHLSQSSNNLQDRKRHVSCTENKYNSGCKYSVYGNIYYDVKSYSNHGIINPGN